MPVTFENWPVYDKLLRFYHEIGAQPPDDLRFKLLWYCVDDEAPAALLDLIVKVAPSDQPPASRVRRTLKASDHRCAGGVPEGDILAPQKADDRAEDPAPLI
jgi:hypothetical protein